MLIKQSVRETLEMQGFRIESVKLVVTIIHDLRYRPRCGVCNSPVITGTGSLKDDFAMCSCGQYR